MRPVQHLLSETQTGGFYHARTAGGVEGWIYRTLAHVDEDASEFVAGLEVVEDRRLRRRLLSEVRVVMNDERLGGRGTRDQAEHKQGARSKEPGHIDIDDHRWRISHGRHPIETSQYRS